MSPRRRTAACACGSLRAETVGEPSFVGLCTCQRCQRLTGSVGTLSASFEEDCITLQGESRTWRTFGESGRWQEIIFCPACGTSIGCRLELLPGDIALSVGCFADPDFPPPTRQFWAKHGPEWFAVTAVERVEEQ